MKKMNNNLRFGSTKALLAKGFTLVELLVVIAIIAVLAGLATPQIMKAKKNADRTTAINNARQIGMALLEFENEYSTFPSEETRRDLEDLDIETVPDGDDANAYLGQLISADFIDSEEVFYAKGVKGARKGDNIMSQGEILTEGENAWGYVMLSDGAALSSSSASSVTPVLVAPLTRGGSEPEFDPVPYNGKMVYFKPDGSTAEARVKKNGQAALTKGRTLFAVGEGTIWERDEPDVREPTGLN